MNSGPSAAASPWPHRVLFLLGFVAGGIGMDGNKVSYAIFGGACVVAGAVLLAGYRRL